MSLTTHRPLLLGVNHMLSVPTQHRFTLLHVIYQNTLGTSISTQIFTEIHYNACIKQFGPLTMYCAEMMISDVDVDGITDTSWDSTCDITL